MLFIRVSVEKHWTRMEDKRKYLYSKTNLPFCQAVINILLLMILLGKYDQLPYRNMEVISDKPNKSGVFVLEVILVLFFLLYQLIFSIEVKLNVFL
jgi:hypothetical protein